MWEAFFAFHICIARCKFLRCQVAQSAVRAPRVVSDPPAFDGLPRIVQSEEPVFVEALLAELAMEAFDVPVLHRPSWCDEVQCDLVLICPLVQSLRGELRAVINDNPYWHAAMLPESVQHSYYAQCRQRGVDFDRQHLPRIRIFNRQRCVACGRR